MGSHWLGKRSNRHQVKPSFQINQAVSGDKSCINVIQNICAATFHHGVALGIVLQNETETSPPWRCCKFRQGLFQSAPAPVGFVASVVHSLPPVFPLKKIRLIYCSQVSNELTGVSFHQSLFNSAVGTPFASPVSVHLSLLVIATTFIIKTS